jgi:HD-like signal output (HDOD) protein
MYNMSDIINSFKEFPAMPNVIMHALNVMRDPESSVKKLARIISYDQSLSTKVLTLVNSSYYGFPQQITSITRAIALIGMSKAKNLILAVAMRPMLTNQGDKNLWMHSILTAVGCEHLAKYLKIMDSDEAFVIGFLHDLGKVVLKIKDAKLYESVESSVKMGSDILEAEQTYFGINHCQIGSILATRWQLPLLVNNVVKYHHTPNLSSMPAACSLAYFIDALVKDDFDASNLDANVMANLKIQIEQPEILKESIKSKAEILLNELSN